MAKLGFSIRKNAAFLIWLLLCILAIIVPPVVIMILYSVDRNKPFLVTPWSAGEMLSYCGVFGAAVIAIFGVYWSLRTDRQAQERLIREESAPFFAAIFLEQKNKRSSFGEELRNANRAQNTQEGEHGDAATPCRKEYDEVDARELYVLLDEEVSYKTKLNREQLEHIQSFDLKESIAPGIHTFVSNPIIYIPLYLKNVGKGPAVAVRVGVNPKGSDWSGVKYWTLMPSDYFYLGIYADTAKDAALGEYELRLVYFDQLDYQYIQRFELNVARQIEKQGPSIQMAFYGQRELLSDEERKRYLSNIKDAL